MKKLLLLVLLVALGVGLHMSKPPEPKRSFVHYLVDHNGENELVAKFIAETCDFQDHYFWVDAKQDGKTVYINVFHNWFNRAEIKKAVQHDVNVTKEKASEVKEKITGQ